MESQNELFEDLPRAADPRGTFETLRWPDGNIVEVPYSIWKDGRKRLDLTELGGRIITSRNAETADRKAIEELRRIFQSRDQIIREHDERAIEIVHRLERRRAPIRKGPRLRNISPSLPTDTITQPAESDFYRPSDYKGPFSNCPEGVEEIVGPTNLAKRVFGHAFATAKRYNVDRVSLNWVRTAKALGATDRGVKNAAFNLRQWRLVWFKSTQGSPLGATVRFLRHPAISGSSEENSELPGGKRIPNSPKSLPKSSEHSSLSNKREEKQEEKKDSQKNSAWRSYGGPAW